MKKIFAIVFIAIFGFGFGQEQEKINTKYEGSIENSLFRKNEVRANALYLVFLGVGGGYERILNDDIGVGVSFLKTYNNDNINLNYYVSPYVRYYLGKKPAAGFFFEGFSSIINYDYSKSGYEYVVDDNKILKSKTTFSLGFSIGNKWVKRSGFTVETFIGVGRTFNNISYEDNFMTKGGISFGYRF